jgi:P-type conjugative transfer protein TrbJ
MITSVVRARRGRGVVRRGLRRLVPALAASLLFGLHAPSAQAQTTCGVNKGGSCIAYQSASISLVTPEGAAVTTTDPTYAKDGPNYEGVLSINPDNVYGGDGILTPPSHGAASDDFGTGVITYRPNPGFVGTDTFVVQTGEPSSGTRVWIYTTTITVTVEPPPAPTADDAAISTAYDTTGSTTLSASNNPTAFTIASGPSHGAASISGTTAVYTPDDGYVGPDSFTFYASNAAGRSNLATVAVTVAAPPAPSAAGGSITTPYDTPAVATLPGTGVISSYAIASSPAHGAITLSGASVTYTPSAGYIGADSFTYEVAGPGGTSAPATVSVTVLPPSAPVAAGQSVTTAFDTPARVTLSGSGVISGFALKGPPGHGTVSLAGSVATYAPASGYIGADSFTFVVTGPGGTSAPATITVTVQAPPVPTLAGAAMTTAYDTPAQLRLAATGLVTSYAIVSPPAHGSAVLSGSTVTYTPDAGYIGPDSFTADAAGPGGVSAPATITVTVEPPPAPVANSGSIDCPYQTTCTTPLTSTGLGSTYTLATQASNGTCSISGSTLTYVPAWGAVGSDSCTFTVTGPGGTSAPATIYITNEPPPLPDPGGPTGAPVPPGASTAICTAGQSASIPGLPGPPTGTAYDPNWCDEQVLTLAQQALQLQNQQSQVAALQSQLALQQKMVQRLGSDAASPTLASVNAEAARILQQARGIGFNAQSAGSAFASAYPGGATVAGFNGSALNAALQTWQANAAEALQTSIAIQNQIAQSQARVAGAVQSAVDASNAAAGPTAAHQATNQILAAVSTQLGQLQDVLLAESEAYAAIAAARQQAGGAAAASAIATQAQVQSAVTPAPGVSDTSHM